MPQSSNNIRLLDNSFTTLAIFDSYESAYFTRSLYEPGTFEIQLNYNIPNASLFARDLWVMFGNDNKKIGIITEVSKSEGENGKADQIVTVSGFEAKYILSWRVVVPPFGSANYNITAPIETVYKTLVNSQCVSNSVDTNRNFTNLTVAADTAVGTYYTLSARYTSLLEELNAVALATDIGYTVYLNTTTKKLVFDIINGIDRSSSQSANARAIFSISNDTIKTSKITDSNVKYKTYMYVGGQGEGTDRIIKEIYNTTTSDINRKEMFVDARNLELESSLITKGQQTLSAYSTTLTVDVDPITSSSLVYNTDYNLGDLVTITSLNVTSNVRLTEAKEAWAPASYVISFAYGKPYPELVQQINGALVKSSFISTVSESGSNSSQGSTVQVKISEYKNAANSLLIPLYVYPTTGGSTAAYANLIAAAKSYTDVMVYVVLNPSSGPGSTVDSNYTDAIAKLQNAGINVLGYVDTNNGSNAMSAVQADIANWRILYPTVDGIFLDSMKVENPLTDATKKYYKTLTWYSHAKGFAPVVSCPGSIVVDAYYANELSDVFVVYKGTPLKPSASRYPSSTLYPRGSGFPAISIVSTGTYNTNYDYTTKAILVYGVTWWDSDTYNNYTKYCGMFYIDDAGTGSWNNLSNSILDQFKIRSSNNTQVTDLINTATAEAVSTKTPRYLGSYSSVAGLTPNTGDWIFYTGISSGNFTQYVMYKWDGTAWNALSYGDSANAAYFSAAFTDIINLPAPSGTPQLTILNALSANTAFINNLYAKHLNAADGTFSGDISAASGTFNGNVQSSNFVSGTSGYKLNGLSGAIEAVLGNFTSCSVNGTFSGKLDVSNIYFPNVTYGSNVIFNDPVGGIRSISSSTTISTTWSMAMPFSGSLTLAYTAKGASSVVIQYKLTDANGNVISSGPTHSLTSSYQAFFETVSGITSGNRLILSTTSSSASDSVDINNIILAVSQDTGIMPYLLTGYWNCRP